MNFDELSLCTDVIELTTKYIVLTNEERQNFLMYLQDEYAGIDDEFSYICDCLISILYEQVYQSKNSADIQTVIITSLETKIHDLCEKCNKENVILVVQNIINYINYFE